ncbi:MAG: 30S ribosomal protein S17 [Candidatus Riflebacteria bacterium]|nr:30S ribosomal protein S17 [Candidatus Riflebacteria bacterium]
METQKTHRRSRVGRVITDNTMQTIKVRLEGIVQHPRYKKYIKRFTTFVVHDPNEECHVGDKVRIEECRPVSKTKHWIVREVLERGNAQAVEMIKEKNDDSSGINS